MNYQTVQTLLMIRSDVQALNCACIHNYSPLQVTGDTIKYTKPKYDCET